MTALRNLAVIAVCAWALWWMWGDRMTRALTRLREFLWLAAFCAVLACALAIALVVGAVRR